MMKNHLNLDQLPLDLAWPQIVEALKTHRNLVLVAEPGAGKTTRLPPLLMESGLIETSKKIFMLEPRRLAARAAAHRIAFERNWKVGEENIGYQVRFDNQTTPATRLQILTEGLLAGKLYNDPELSDVGAVILDEFHERSQHTDLAIGLLSELQQLARSDLRIIVMSATLDAEKVASYLSDCPVVRVPGRSYPVEVHHGKRPLSLETGPSFFDLVAQTVLDAISGKLAAPRNESGIQAKGDVLVFLPGAREIRGVRERLHPRIKDQGFECFELHGSLSLDEQDRAIRKIPGIRKIILATNIAETSLTIDGVNMVIDSGLARVLRADSAGFPRLQISRISLASAKQRTGRAGRQSAGVCHRMWSKMDEASMPPFEIAEIHRTDLTEPLMTLLAQGVTDPFSFSWFEKPDTRNLSAAMDTLSDLGFRDANSTQLTAEGKEALKLPLPPRLARLMIEAIKIDEIALGAKLAALLSEKDFLIRGYDLKRSAVFESDLIMRLHLLESAERDQGFDRNAVRNILRVSQALESSAKRIQTTALNKSKLEFSGSPTDKAIKLLLLAFPDRLARRRRPGERSLLLVGGKGASLTSFSVVETAELLLALDSYEPPPGTHATTGAKPDAQISMASYVDRSWIESAFPNSIKKQAQIIYDEESQAVQLQTATFFHDLPLESPHLGKPAADLAFPVLVSACLEKWETVFMVNEKLQGLFARLDFLKEHLGTDKDSVFSLESARTGFLEEVCFGETKLAQVLAKDLKDAFLRHLPPGTVKLLERAAPDEWVAPSGSRVKIRYPNALPPQIEIRIQEIFGLVESPRVALGKVPIVMHLLGPNFRPVQVTSDLGSFWRTGYSEVRKELRARYPKHSWPEDPWTARPEARGGKRRN